MFVSTDGSDAGCVRYATRPASPKACSSFERAYRLAKPGDTVAIEAGTYGDQEIDADPAKRGSTAVVTFRPATSGAHVTVNGYLRLGLDPFQEPGHPGPSYVTIRDIAVLTRAEAYTPAQHVVWDRITGGAFYIRGVEHMRIERSSWGPCWSDSEPSPAHPCNENTKIEGGGSSGEQTTSDVVIDRSLFHDFTITQNHFECMILDGGVNITVEHSTFRNCQIYDIDISNDGVGLKNLRLTRNVFGQPSGGQPLPWAVNFQSGSPPQPLTGISVVANSFLSGAGITQSSGTIGAVAVSRNVMGYHDCLSNVVYRDNFWPGGACGDSSNVSGRIWGYTLADGVLKVDPRVLGLRKAVHDAAAGMPTSLVLRELARAHVPAPGSRRWTLASFLQVVANPVYRGGHYGVSQRGLFSAAAAARVCKRLGCPAS